MIARVAKKNILPAVLRAASISDKRSVVPILSHVLLDFSESKITIKATDLDHSIIEEIPAEVDTFGTTAVPVGVFSDIVRKTSDSATLEFSLTDKGSKFVVTAGRSKFELATLSCADFPEVTCLKVACCFSVNSAEFNKLISRTKFSISQEENRHNLNGIYFHKEEEKLKAASTDGHRLSVSEMKINIKESIQGMIVSKKTIFEVKKLLDIFQNEIEIAFSANQIQFTFGSVVLISKLVDGNFPDYKRVIPDNNGDFFIVKRSDFIEIVDRVAVISNDKVRSIKLELSKNNLSCYATNSRVGVGRDEVEIVYSGQDWSAGFNVSYLLDVAQTLQGEFIKVYIKESLSPILIVDESEIESLFVVMPMRI